MRNRDRARALKKPKEDPFKRDLDGIQAQLTGLSQAVKATRSVPAPSLTVHTVELLSVIEQVRSLADDLGSLVGSIDGLSERIGSMPDYSDQLVRIESKIPDQTRTWHFTVNRADDSTITDVVAEPS